MRRGSHGTEKARTRGRRGGGKWGNEYVETRRIFHRQNAGMSFQEMTFTQCKHLPETLKPFPAAQAQEIQPITKDPFKEISVSSP